MYVYTRFHGFSTGIKNDGWIYAAPNPAIVGKLNYISFNKEGRSSRRDKGSILAQQL